MHIFDWRQTPCFFYLFIYSLFFLSLISLLTVSKTNKHQPAIGLQLSREEKGGSKFIAVYYS
jgi:hypothetical protein